MTLTLNADPGASDANSYATLEEANAYFEGRVGGEAWLNADESDRERALVDATRTIDLRRFAGYRASNAQALAWPRIGVIYDGVSLDGDTIPTFVVHATCEQAFARLQGSVTPGPTGLEAFQSLSIGPVSLTMSGNAPAPGALAPAAQRLLTPVIVGGGANSLRVIPS